MEKISEYFQKNLKALRGNMKQKDFALSIGVKPATYSRYEGYGRVPRVDELERIAAALNTTPERLLAPPFSNSAYEQKPNVGMILRDAPGMRLVPVVSIAQAGEMQGRGYFEDIANQIDDQTPTESKDPNAFAVEISGDSMEPEFHARDWVVVEPNREPRNGDAVLVKTCEGKVFFKWFLRSGPEGKIIRLESENPDYSTMEFDVEQILWVYPAVDVKRRIIPRRSRK